MGQTLEVGGRLVLCGDTGSAIEGNRYHVDIWFHTCGDQQDPAPDTGWAWLQEVGTREMVEVMTR